MFLPTALQTPFREYLDSNNHPENFILSEYLALKYLGPAKPGQNDQATFDVITENVN